MCESKEQVKHGNYHNYYNFRTEDSRSSILRQYLETVWCSDDDKPVEKPVTHMLDIGCNSGQFTAKVRQILEELSGGTVRVSAIGVDIDQELCDRASRDFPGIEFICGNVLSIATSEQGDRRVDPIECGMLRLGIEQFDVICCFSVLMYVHLNGGDEGLRRVLDYLCNKGKFLILELQSWKKYRDQVRRLKRDAGQTYPNYEQLAWKGGCGALENHIKSYIQSNGFELLAESVEKNEFDRQLIFFRNKCAIPPVRRGW
uniref:RNA methyltransferase n=1 Tax=Anopheles farauti TaxID=69004 RepID=A0A182QVM9_9DIPT